MLSRRLLGALHPLRQPTSLCLFCSTRALIAPPHSRPLSATVPLQSKRRKKRKKTPNIKHVDLDYDTANAQDQGEGAETVAERAAKSRRARRRTYRNVKAPASAVIRKIFSGENSHSTLGDGKASEVNDEGKSLKDAMGASTLDEAAQKKEKKQKKHPIEMLPVETLKADSLEFQPVDHEIPPIPMLSYGLDRVLFNPGVYRLQDPRSRVYNFDPYLEKIMPAPEFNFDALTEYKTSSKDEDLLAITRREGTKFTGSTSSMTGALQHFHFLLSNNRPLNHEQMSRKFPLPAEKAAKASRKEIDLSKAAEGKFSKITRGPSAIFLRWKDGLYAIDADKSYDSPNIMSWLGHSLEKLLTSSRSEFEKFRRSNKETTPSEDDSGKCFHYSKLGNFLMRSQLDAHDKRLPGTGVFDLKTRAVVSIRMDHKAYDRGSGYQLRYDQGEWESFEREFYDMTRATLLKYSLQVRMGRMDGIFVAYHNIERIFGFQYFSLPDMDRVLHGQTDTCLGDQEFRLSISLLDQVLQQATVKYPETSIRLHFETVGEKAKYPYMYIFAEPVTEEEADSIQSSKSDVVKAFEREHIGVEGNDPEVQAEWQDIQDQVDEQLDSDPGPSSTSSSSSSPEFESESESEPGPESDPESADTFSESSDMLSEESPSTKSKEKKKKREPTDPSKPLTGWTLTVRNFVNGTDVPRPQNLSETDTWSIEYLLKEIPTDALHRTYDKLLGRREALFSQDREEVDKQLNAYRELIHEYSKQGRKWREEQDTIDEKMGIRVYKPLGPGSEEVIKEQGPRAVDT